MTDYATGIDVSYAQGRMDWNKARAQGIAFAFARANYGLHEQDSQIANNWPGMKAAGLLRGAYAFFIFNQSAEQQAEFTLSIVGNGGDFPLVVDIEKFKTSGVDETPAAERVEKLHTWLDYVERQTGRKPIIYTSAYEWQITVNSTEFGDYPLWVANETSAAQPYLPSGWKSWLFWQYAADKDGLGRQYGAQSADIDLDRFNGTVADLHNLTSGSSTITPPQLTTSTYTVQPGDTLWKIANEHDTTVDALVKLNNIANPDAIEVGEALKVNSTQ